MRSMNKRGDVGEILLQLGKAALAAMIVLALLALGVKLYQLFTGSADQATRESYKRLGDAIKGLKENEGIDVAVQIQANLNIFGFNPEAGSIKVFNGGPAGGADEIITPSECRDQACICLCDDKCEKRKECTYLFENIKGGFVASEEIKRNEGLPYSDGSGETLALAGSIGWGRDFGLKILNVMRRGDWIYVTIAKAPSQP